MRAALLAFALIGCAAIAPERPPAGTCDAGRLSRLVGRPGTPELGAEAQRRSGAARLRWIRPGDVVTMDFSPQRLNIHLDARGRVESFACG
jgi:Peptidase inhibitor I78 family